ncbi:hypothetical protein CL654_03125 [bacterium]|nr:hypothetical protein [bacterium]|tara:strand:- start:10381 stop:11760 length:1380 start_codon:yes stop_codon:yes gene_type:complete
METGILEIGGLRHTVCDLSSGGMVLALNKGEQIGAEAEAMLQAFYSRDPGVIVTKLEELDEKDERKFMDTYYVGYAHKSIGDCGSVTIFIEGVSMLVAKAVQDFALYNGQECSTRYIDFAHQPFVDPIGSLESKGILDEWRTFYLTSQEEVVAHLMELYPRGTDEKKGVYEKAIKARAFDILRGFLPAGAETNLAWHGELRQVADHLMRLRNHPLAEVREVADAAHSVLLKTHPDSFGHKRYEAMEGYLEWWMKELYYFRHAPYNGVEVLRDGVDPILLSEYQDAMKRRPAKTELPKIVAECGTMQFGFMLDFGSFRDVQRHRAVIQRMPLVTDIHDFEPWYLNALPTGVAKGATRLLAGQRSQTNNLDESPLLKQYYIPMGYQLPNRLSGDLPALVYLVELRATRFVHPTLVSKASAMAEHLTSRFGNAGLVLHLDDEPGRFDVKRGEQDITRRSASS